MHVNSTCDLVPDELAALHLTNGGEEGADFLLSHGLGQVVDDEVGLGPILVAAIGGHRAPPSCRGALAAR